MVSYSVWEYKGSDSCHSGLFPLSALCDCRLLVGGLHLCDATPEQLLQHEAWALRPRVLRSESPESG
jgi:hypothetical protein